MGRIKRFIFAAIVVLLAIGASSLHEARAISTWSTSDGFETATQANWSFWHEDPTDFGSLRIGLPGLAHSGNNYAEIWTLHGGWSEVGRYVSLPQTSRTLHCTLSFWLNNWSSTLLPQNIIQSSGEGQIEVIDVATWTYVAIKPFSLGATAPWTKLTTDPWIPPRKDILVRVGALRPSANEKQELHVDDMAVNCLY